MSIIDFFTTVAYANKDYMLPNFEIDDRNSINNVQQSNLSPLYMSQEPATNSISCENEVMYQSLNILGPVK